MYTPTRLILKIEMSGCVHVYKWNEDARKRNGFYNSISLIVMLEISQTTVISEKTTAQNLHNTLDLWDKTLLTPVSSPV